MEKGKFLLQTVMGNLGVHIQKNKIEEKLYDPELGNTFFDVMLTITSYKSKYW